MDRPVVAVSVLVDQRGGIVVVLVSSTAAAARNLLRASSSLLSTFLDRGVRVARAAVSKRGRADCGSDAVPDVSQSEDRGRVAGVVQSFAVLARDGKSCTVGTRS